MKSFYFDCDQFDGLEDSRNVFLFMQKTCQMTKDYIKIYEHADECSTREYNFASGERRAHAAERVFIIS